MTTVRHTIIFDPAHSPWPEPYRLCPGSTDEHAAALADSFGNNALRVERTEVTVISTPSTAVGRAPFADFVKEARRV